jgi:transposase
MAAKAPKLRASRRRWQPAEKRRLVELTLQPGSSIGAIAREHGVYPTSLRQWKALFLAGKLEAVSRLQSALPADAPTASATFLPVSLIRAVSEQPAARRAPRTSANAVMQLEFANGTSLRIETDALDAALVCSLVAELRR